MKKLALSFVVLMVAGVGGAAGAIGCSSSSSTGTENDSGTAGDVTTGGDDGSTEAASGDDTGVTADTGMPGTDGGTEAGPACMTDAGVDFQVPNPDGGTAIDLTACNACINTSCTTQACPCITDPTLDDAGQPACLEFAGCLLVGAQMYVAANPDAGLTGIETAVAQTIAPACVSADGTSQTTAGNGEALALCVAQSCLMQCTGQ